jgi:site-specific DNA-methyltransferase (adenine-specific)
MTPTTFGKLASCYLADCMDVMKTMADNSVEAVITDIPFDECNIKEDRGLRKIGKDTADVINFDLDTFVNECIRVSKGSIYIFCGYTQFSSIVKNFNTAGLTNRMLAWIKPNPSPMNGDRMWMSGIEIGVFARKSKAKFNVKCKNTNFHYPKGSSKQHPTEKPIQLMTDFVLASTDPGDIVFDPCMGSGTTGVAAIRHDRKFIGCELFAPYFETSIKRISREANKIASLVDFTV